MPTSRKVRKCILPFLLIFALLLPSAASAEQIVPGFSGEAVIELNNCIPVFSADDLSAEDYVSYSELDALGRPGPALALLSGKALTTELRAESGDDLPVGWKTVRYEDVIPEQYLYSLCAILSPELGGAGADSRNIFTGTRYLRTEGMRPFEKKITDYLRRTPYHVLYRVTPLYRGDDLVPTGVQMEACSVEDSGRSVRFNVIVYNIQPGIEIDYSNGESQLNESVAVSVTANDFLKRHVFPPLAEMEQPKYESFQKLFDEYSKSVAAAVAARNQQAGSISIPGTVYIPDNDDPNKRFHRSADDSGNNPIPISIESAAKSYEPCGNCWSKAEIAFLKNSYR